MEKIYNFQPGDLFITEFGNTFLLVSITDTGMMWGICNGEDEIRKFGWVKSVELAVNTKHIKYFPVVK
jgi:hypothetical protein